MLRKSVLLIRKQIKKIRESLKVALMHHQERRLVIYSLFSMESNFMHTESMSGMKMTISTTTDHSPWD
jgi:hypothetical protein